jgi:uroporphyrinogen decarboxylase
MRQAGRYMPRYRELRSKVGFLELCKNAELASQVTLMAVRELNVDAAIIFADILLIVEPLGVGLEFSKGEGPVIHRPIALAEHVHNLTPYAVSECLPFVLEAIRETRRELPAHVPLIGFAGAPFTLASYLIEGGASRHFEKTKAFMYNQPEAWHALMTLLGSLTSQYLNLQIQAGASVLQIFDSWVGCLSEDDYLEFVLPHTQKTIACIDQAAPVIHFGTGTGHLLKHMASCGGQVIGLDWRVTLDQAWHSVGCEQFAVQGNLDPCVLLVDRPVIRRKTMEILRQAGGRPGHIFNLGHGILPTTPLDNAKYLVDVVHELSQQRL